MDPILDFNISDNSDNRVYKWWVDNAPLIDEVIARWHTKKFGEPPHKHAEYHGIWRVVEERERWGTLRVALQDTWPIDGDLDSVPSPNPIPHPSPVDPPVIDPPLDSTATGGILMHSSDTSIRSFPNPQLPGQGPFLFPGYSTQACRITHDGHKIRSVGMSYSNNINAHGNQNSLKVFLSVNDILFIFTINKETLNVVDIHDTGIHHTGEMCYWDKVNPYILYYYQGNKLNALNVSTGSKGTIFETEGNIWQPHTSRDGKTHSFTMKDDNWNPVCWAVYDEWDQELHKFPIEGKPDECQIDKSGDWITIKETFNRNGKDYDDVRVINLKTKQEITYLDEQGAPGHSDCGFNCIIGEDNYNDVGSALVQWNFDGSITRRLLYHTDYWNLGHFSFCNAIDLPISEQYGLISPGGHLNSRGKELVSVKLDGSGRCLVLCDSLNELWGEGQYDNLPKANLCPHGQFVVWSAWHDGRRDAFLVKIPKW